MNTESCEQNVEQSPCKPRRCWTGAALVAGLLICLLVVGLVWNARRNRIAGPPLLKADANQLKQTLVTPHSEATIRPGENVLWCSTFQLVWNEICRYAGGDVHLSDEPPIVPILNKKSASEKDVDLSSCLVLSGLIEKGVVDNIRQELDRKFHGQAEPDLLNSIEPGLPKNGYLAYAYLFRTLPFEYPLKRLGEPLAFGSAKVASFGLRDVTSRMDDMHKAEQINVLDYTNGDDFVVALQPKDKNERIVLAKIAPAETLQSTIEAVRFRIRATRLEQWQHNLHMGETLVVPVLNFEVWKLFEELPGKTITTPGPLQGTPIGICLQTIRFRLDERGAILKSEAMTAKAVGGPDPRQLIFDKPFLILLERRDSQQPYFALWVDNAELLALWK